MRKELTAVSTSQTSSSTEVEMPESRIHDTEREKCVHVGMSVIVVTNAHVHHFVPARIHGCTHGRHVVLGLAPRVPSQDSEIVEVRPEPVRATFSFL